MGVTINKHIYVSVNRLGDFFQSKTRVGYSRAELVDRVQDIQHPSVRETLMLKKMGGNLDIHIFADLPARTGLGSSSAFTVGFLNALYALVGRSVTKQQLAEEAIYIEQERIQENVGCQDQVHAAYGGLNVIEFGTSGEISVRSLDISEEKCMLFNASLMVFYTGLTRHASEILSEQIENMKTCRKDGYLKRMYEIVFEAEQLFSDESPNAIVQHLGELLHESWQLKKNLSSKITNGFIDDAYAKARAAGAYGGKLAGAGGGGFLFVLAPKERQVDVKKALDGLSMVDVEFEKHGSTIIFSNV